MNNIFPVESKISTKKRAELMGQKPCVIWFTGLSGSGKSTIATMIENHLFALGYKAYLLDGDNIRDGLNQDLSFSDKDRKENIRRIGEVSKLMADAGLIVISAFISPFKSDRDDIKNIIGEERLVEVFIDCPLEICEQRDVKGLYKKARNGEIKQFTGIDSPYERPENPSIVIETHIEEKEVSVKKIIQLIESKIKL